MTETSSLGVHRTEHGIYDDELFDQSEDNPDVKPGLDKRAQKRRFRKWSIWDPRPLG